jgi:predicted phosphodiesterase
MRMALISDVHGNATALQAVLDDIAGARVDEVVCLGDVATLGPEPSRTLELIDTHCSVLIAGNHEQFLLDPPSVHAYTSVAVVLEAIAWCVDALGDDDRRVLQRAVPMARRPLGRSELLAYHGTPRSNVENLLATTPAEEVDEMLDGHRAPVMAGGHTHIPLLRRHHRELLVNPGSVGMPFERFVGASPPTVLPFAEYAIIDGPDDAAAPHGTDVRVEFRRVHVDLNELVRTLRASANPFSALHLREYSRL